MEEQDKNLINKVLRVIDSCETREQLDVATNYAELARPRILQSFRNFKGITESFAIHMEYTNDIKKAVRDKRKKLHSECNSPTTNRQKEAE